MKPDQQNKPIFDTSDLGCYFDCSRGIYKCKGTGNELQIKV